MYVANPADSQQQLAVFDLGGTTYLVTDGSTAGSVATTGINPGTLWAATATTAVETQFGLVYGFAATPTTVTETTLPSGATLFQFLNSASGVTTLYDIDYTAGALGNHVQVDVPSTLPSFDKPRPFDFVAEVPPPPSRPSATTRSPRSSTSTAFRRRTTLPPTTARSIRPIRTLSQPTTAQGDFSVELWHSVPAEAPGPAHPVVYTNGSIPTADDQIFHVDIDYENPSDLWVRLNDTVMYTPSPRAFPCSGPAGATSR